jgi:hypothetical protein
MRGTQYPDHRLYSSVRQLYQVFRSKLWKTAQIMRRRRRLQNDCLGEISQTSKIKVQSSDVAALAMAFCSATLALDSLGMSARFTQTE